MVNNLEIKGHFWKLLNQASEKRLGNENFFPCLKLFLIEHVSVETK